MKEAWLDRGTLVRQRVQCCVVYPLIIAVGRLAESAYSAMPIREKRYAQKP